MNFDKSTGTSYHLLEFLSYLVNHRSALLTLGWVIFWYFYLLFEMVDMVSDAADEKQLLTALTFSLSTSDVVWYSLCDCNFSTVRII